MDGKRISRVLSPATPEADHFSRSAVTRALEQPTRNWRPCGHRRGPRLVPYLALLPVGFTVPSLLPGTRGSLTPPFHPYLGPRGPSAVCSLLHFPSPCDARSLAGTVPSGARTFLGRATAHERGRAPGRRVCPGWFGRRASGPQPRSALASRSVKQRDLQTGTPSAWPVLRILKIRDPRSDFTNRTRACAAEQRTRRQTLGLRARRRVVDASGTQKINGIQRSSQSRKVT